jgi:hypothetical protein
MNSTMVNELQVAPRDGTAVSFSEPYERDGVTVISASAQRRHTFRGGPQDAEAGARLSSSHPRGAFVVKDGEVRWHPAVDITRLLTTAEIVVGAVLVAHRLARRPSAAKAQVTMGPGGWVSLKGGAVAVRPASRPWGRPRPPATRSEGTQRPPVWARLISAVPLQSLIR